MSARTKMPAAPTPHDLAPPVAPQRQARRATTTDALETEADRAAGQVLAGRPAPRLTARASGTGTASPAAGRAGAAQALPAGVRGEMERGFARDFSQVRVHTNETAAASAHELDANAYTTGNDIVFGEGRYAPQTPDGRRLIAHELAHVAQQESGGARAGSVQREPRDPDELAAEAKEDDAIVAKAKRALASENPAMAVHEIVWRLINNHHLDEHFELNGSRYDAARKGIVVELSGKGPRTTGTIVAGREVLQRLAAGKAADVVKEIEAQIGTVGTARGTVDLVFIMGADAPKSGNRFYAEAVAYFKAQHAGATMFEDVRDLDGINQRINSTGQPVANLIIVSHAHPDGTLQFSLDPADKTPGQVQFSELKEANAAGSLTQPDPKLVGFWTNVSIRGCNLGRSPDTMSELKTAFGGDVRVIAPTHAQRFGGGTQSIAGPFYEEKGASKLKDDAAFELIKKKPEYAFITDWDRMRPTLTRRNVGGKPATYYDEAFPAAGKEMDFLIDRKGKAFAQDFTFGGSRVEGDKTVFEYRAKDPTKIGNVEIAAETPPTDAQAEAFARAQTADPDTYAYEVKRTRTGVKLKVEVTARKTEWELYHSEIKKKGKGFNPREGSRPWFGDTGW